MSMLEQVKPAPARADRESGGGIRGWWSRTREFLADVRSEMRRVTWPSRREVYATTVVVILTASFFGLYLWGLDLAINWAVTRVFRLFGAS